VAPDAAAPDAAEEEDSEMPEAESPPQGGVSGPFRGVATWSHIEPAQRGRSRDRSPTLSAYSGYSSSSEP
jgi:hypothetical protein